MGYQTWSEWCDHELNGFPVPTRLDRPRVVCELAEQGLSNRAIADAIGVSRQTVNNDLAGDKNLPPDPDRKVTGKDGKSYPATKPRPTPEQPAEEPERRQFQCDAVPPEDGTRPGAVPRNDRHAEAAPRLPAHTQTHGALSSPAYAAEAERESAF